MEYKKVPIAKYIIEFNIQDQHLKLAKLIYF